MRSGSIQKALSFPNPSFFCVCDLVPVGTWNDVDIWTIQLLLFKESVDCPPLSLLLLLFIFFPLIAHFVYPRGQKWEPMSLLTLNISSYLSRELDKCPWQQLHTSVTREWRRAPLFLSIPGSKECCFRDKKKFLLFCFFNQSPINAKPNPIGHIWCKVS